MPKEGISELEKGNVSLLLTDVRLADQGDYKCHVSLGDWFEEPTLELTVRRELFLSGFTKYIFPALNISYNMTIFIKALMHLCSSEKKLLHVSILVRLLVNLDDVTLDEKTAHPKLRVAEDGKSAGWVEKDKTADGKNKPKEQSIDINSKRFDDQQCVLAKEGFTSGRHYWQVEFGKQASWQVGVGKETKDKQEILTSVKGYWILNSSSDTSLSASTAPPTILPTDLKPERVGVYLDYEEGQISFYNVDHRCHIYTFKDEFTVKLFPLFGTKKGCFKIFTSLPSTTIRSILHLTPTVTPAGGGPTGGGIHVFASGYAWPDPITRDPVTRHMPVSSPPGLAPGWGPGLPNPDGAK
uniref:B30.2/SPRY domain-containing protein n=1 Tax=Paramormyrops kingsleyae TaxID=1676925 RepID=A0A3B3QRZ3_9TELE